MSPYKFIYGMLKNYQLTVRSPKAEEYTVTGLNTKNMVHFSMSGPGYVTYINGSIGNFGRITYEEFLAIVENF